MSRRRRRPPRNLCRPGGPKNRRRFARSTRRAALGGARTGAKADGFARPGWWARSRRRWAKDVRRRAARRASSRWRASAAQAVAARNARRCRSAPANGGFSCKTASSKARLAPAKKAAPKPTAGVVGGRAQDGKARSNSGLCGAKLGAAARDDGAAVTPRGMGKAPAAKVGSSLVARKLVREIRSKPGMPIWREMDGKNFSLVITRAGRNAIGVADDAAASHHSATKATRPRASAKTREASAAAQPEKRSIDGARRPGSKQALISNRPSSY